MTEQQFLNPEKLKMPTDPSSLNETAANAASGGLGGILGGLFTLASVFFKFATKDELKAIRSDGEASVDKLKAHIAERYVTNDRLESIVTAIHNDVSEMKQDNRASEVRIINRIDQLADRGNR